MAGTTAQATRYAYRFERVELGGFPLASRKPKEDYHRLVEERARDGWRLVQIFSPSTSVAAGGVSEWFELIFERPVA